MKLSCHPPEEKHPQPFRFVRHYDEEKNMSSLFSPKPSSLQLLKLHIFTRKDKWSNSSSNAQNSISNGVRYRMPSVSRLLSPLYPLILWLWSIMIWIWKALPMKSCKSQACPLVDKARLTAPFDKTKFNEVKELDSHLIPRLFDQPLTFPILTKRRWPFLMNDLLRSHARHNRLPIIANVLIVFWF